MNNDWLNAFIPKSDNANGNDWYYKYAAKTSPPSAPQTTAVEIPSTVDHTQFYAALLQYNNGLTNFKGLTGLAASWTDKIKGVIIHKVDQVDAERVAARIKVAAPAMGLPETFTAGCLAIESTLDPNCQNGNLGPGESNTANDPGGYDMGVAQLKLKYLVGLKSTGCTTVEEAKAFALNVDKAIPYHCSLMAGHVLWAQNVIQQNTSSVPDARFATTNGYLLLATGAYNFGETGMMKFYENGTFPSHCQQVMDLEKYFANKIGVTSVFEEVN